jgi:hypothetical protein
MRTSHLDFSVQWNTHPFLPSICKKVITHPHCRSNVDFCHHWPILRVRAARVSRRVPAAAKSVSASESVQPVSASESAAAAKSVKSVQDLVMANHDETAEISHTAIEPVEVLRATENTAGHADSEDGRNELGKEPDFLQLGTATTRGKRALRSQKLPKPKRVKTSRRTLWDTDGPTPSVTGLSVRLDWITENGKYKKWRGGDKHNGETNPSLA